MTNHVDVISFLLAICAVSSTVFFVSRLSQHGSVPFVFQNILGAILITVNMNTGALSNICAILTAQCRSSQHSCDEDMLLSRAGRRRNARLSSARLAF